MFKLKQLKTLARFQMPSERNSDIILERRMESLCEYNEKAELTWTFPLNQ